MRRNIFFMSLMLLGLGSLFTSCVDVDYYDLYDDEEELLLPRDKKGKDVVNVDLSQYPIMNCGEGEYNGWFEYECVACCYSNIFGADKVTSRYLTIEAAYNNFNDETCYEYFADVMYNGGVPKKTVRKLFGSSHFSVQKLAKYCVAKNVGSYYPVGNNNWVVFASASNSTGTHVAKVTSLSLYPEGDKYIVSIRVTDQNGTDHPKYQLELDKNKKFIRDDEHIEYFIGSCNY